MKERVGRKKKAGQKMKRGLRYIHGDSVIHQLDPRTKLFALISISIASLLSTNLLVIGIICVFVLACAAVSGLFKKWIHEMYILLPMVITIIVIDLFFTSRDYPYGGVLYSGDLWFLHLEATLGTVLFATAMSLRILAIGGFSFLFVMTTPYDLFVKSIRLLGVPQIFTFSLGYALRSVTALSSDLVNIMDAQRSRGLVFNREMLFKNPLKFLSLFVPMVVSVMNRSDQVSDAMQCRGYGLRDNPSIYRSPCLRRIDYCAFFIVFAVVALVIAVMKYLVQV